jgi:hypothetical protein
MPVRREAGDELGADGAAGAGHEDVHVVEPTRAGLREDH